MADKLTPSQPSPTNLSDELKYILSCVYYAGVQSTLKDATIRTPTMSREDAKAAITTAYAEAINEIIGEDEYSIDPLWAGHRGYWARNELRAEQRQRLKGLLPNGKDGDDNPL